MSVVRGYMTNVLELDAGVVAAALVTGRGR